MIDKKVAWAFSAFGKIICSITRSTAVGVVTLRDVGEGRTLPHLAAYHRCYVGWTGGTFKRS